MSATEHERTSELIAAHRATLHQYEKQLATLGTAAPAHIPQEIARIRHEIARLSESAVDDAMTVRQLYTLMTAHLMRIEADVIYLRGRFDAALDAALGVRMKPPPPTKPAPRPRRVNGE